MASDYENIVRHCIKNSQLWEDPEFPAEQSSVFYHQKPPFTFQWKRPRVSSPESDKKTTFEIRLPVGHGRSNCGVLQGPPELFIVLHTECCCSSGLQSVPECFRVYVVLHPECCSFIALQFAVHCRVFPSAE